MITESLIAELKDKEFRDAFMASHAKQSIIFQITDMLKEAAIKQKELESRSGVAQSTISRTLDPEFSGGASISTLVRIAQGFDVAFVPHFVPYTDLLDWLDSDRLSVATFQKQLEGGAFTRFLSSRISRRRRLPARANMVALMVQDDEPRTVDDAATVDPEFIKKDGDATPQEPTYAEAS